ncbi:antirestriction protein ArdA [Nocardia sp. CC227C]|uniref:antirestriction protein ArdA n=1 Tax=Nocardia sp. CC227C TaxID=3044562 RepID=UPI00278BEC72|nr:antirestriction protein ArdA [Nocardia sp. CC227C]
MHEQFPQIPNSNENEPDIGSATPDVERGYESKRRLLPRIYVTRSLPLRAELTDGAWFDMARDPALIRAELYAVFEQEEVEHPLCIWDYQDFGSFGVTTGAIGLEGVQTVELLAAVAQGITKHGAAFAAWAAACEHDPAQFGAFNRTYRGHHDSLAAFACTLLMRQGILDQLRLAAPEAIRAFVHIDYEAIGQAMLQRGAITTVPADTGGVWVFDANQ